MRDLLECAWPAALDSRATTVPLEDLDRRHCSVIVDRDGGDLARFDRLGATHCEHAVRRVIIKHGGHKPCLRIVDKLFADPTTGRGGRAPGGPAGWSGCSCCSRTGSTPTAALVDTETRMTGVLDELPAYPTLVTTITGPSAGRCRRDPSPDRRPPPLRHRTGPVSNTQALPRARNCPARSSGAPNSPAKAGPDYA